MSHRSGRWGTGRPDTAASDGVVLDGDTSKRKAASAKRVLAQEAPEPEVPIAAQVEEKLAGFESALKLAAEQVKGLEEFEERLYESFKPRLRQCIKMGRHTVKRIEEMKHRLQQALTEHQRLEETFAGKPKKRQRAQAALAAALREASYQERLNSLPIAYA